MTTPNYYNTPHSAGAARESVRRTLEMSVENILWVASGKKPHNMVSL
jgi:phosphoglycerate dehydrogenase-like enzyme